jgi:hypothetical protein
MGGVIAEVTVCAGEVQILAAQSREGKIQNDLFVLRQLEKSEQMQCSTTSYHAPHIRRVMDRCRGDTMPTFVL